MTKKAHIKTNTTQCDDFVDWMLSIDVDSYELKRAQRVLAGIYSSAIDLSNEQER